MQIGQGPPAEGTCQEAARLPAIIPAVPLKERLQGTADADGRMPVKLNGFRACSS
ncbi:hypothetical protein [Xylanibacillus composti]|uniref:Uncharacterized protein n=1 Tax=Xylanibacillus composti TaxID=1572762 RepID=A0A8J4H3Y6_9BACL|nr:hypothetical protein [Xylanibacillus composti]GIQ69205.1 hypothetical protein XYCOK13_20290 [Xylanibacillus composti]